MKNGQADADGQHDLEHRVHIFTCYQFQCQDDLERKKQPLNDFLFAVGCCWLLLFAVVCCLLLCAVCCCVLLVAVVCCCCLLLLLL